jgi:hypothetical protein
MKAGGMMTKMTYHTKVPMHTTQLVFIRREGLNTSNVALATVTTAKKISVQAAMQKLEAAVTDWVKNTQSGRKCYEYSGGKVTREVGSKTSDFCGGDLNIGDLATHEEQFLSDGQDYLRKQGILDFNIQYVRRPVGRHVLVRSHSCEGVTIMDILVGIHIGSDWNDGGFNCARLSLDDKAIKHIFTLAGKAKKGYIAEFDYTPELGTTQVDLSVDDPYRNIADLPSTMGDNEVFKTPAEDSNDAPRIDISELHVDKDDFWFEGVFKHTDVHWETRMIPLSFLPQELRPEARKVQSGNTTDLNMTTEEMNAIHEKIAQGVSNGLNAREIEATFQRHVTKAQLIRCMIELIERG